MINKLTISKRYNLVFNDKESCAAFFDKCYKLIQLHTTKNIRMPYLGTRTMTVTTYSSDADKAFDDLLEAEGLQ